MNGPIYNLPFRRRRDQQTNYPARLALVKSGKPRLVVRRTLNNFIVQMMEFKMEGDVTVASSTSLDLKKLGWNGHTGNIPAAYLAGYLCGLRAHKAGVTEAVLDMGLHQNVKGSSIYAVLKGVIDSGINVPHDKEILPSDERISGKHIEAYGKSKNAGNIIKEFTSVKAKIKSEVK